MRVRIGPLWLNPRVVLSNLGVDTNVFDVPDSRGPQKDFTATVTPTTDIWMRIGPSWLQVNVREDVVWYQKLESERSANNAYDVTWRATMGRLLVTLNPKYVATRERPGYEIDARAQRKEYGGTAKVELRALSKTFIGVNVATQHVNFDDTATFLGTNLHDDLNRTTTTYGGSVRHQLTPLTAVTVDAAQTQDRFEFNPLRDSNSTAVRVGLGFDPFALIKGSATFGVRDFAPLSPGLPSYRGFVGTADLSYTLLGATRFAVQWKRDISFSFDNDQPYYLENGFNGSITQQVFGPFDAMVRGGVAHLDYRDRAGAAVAVVDRSDEVRSYGVGVGYHFAEDLRLGFNVDKQQRISPVADREYSGLRYGTSLTVGF